MIDNLSHADSGARESRIGRGKERQRKVGGGGQIAGLCHFPLLFFTDFSSPFQVFLAPLSALGSLGMIICVLNDHNDVLDSLLTERR